VQTKLSVNVAADVLSAHPPAQSVAIWWLGQASFVLKSGQATYYIDPFLSPLDGRLVSPPFTAEEAPAADIIFCTHEHIDHLDCDAYRILAQNSPQARFIAPRPIVDQLEALGIAAERIVGVQPGEELDLVSCKVFPIAAMHGLQSPPAIYDFGLEISNGLYRYLGYVIAIDGIHIYHSGDTLVYDGLIERLRELHIDVALLPMNGRNYFREQKNLIGNMDEREAVELAAMAGADLLIPTHYEMFAANLGRPGALIDYLRATHPELACSFPSHGRRFVYTKC
jgi:L-ascorbate 6-phosphate lactonase